MKLMHVGYVVNRHTNTSIPVAISDRSKREAGELAEKWLQDHAQDQLDYFVGGAWTVSGDYIQIERRGEGVAP